ncbi:MAG: SCO family protein [Deltaproteobacteria bacterium]
MNKGLSSGIIFIIAVFNLSVFSPATASLSPQETLDKQDALMAANKAIGGDIGNHTLIDQDGNSFNIKEFIGKPFIISLIYTSCGHICPTITMNLGNAVKEAGKDFGNKFNVITIGFDIENDTPQRMKEYGRNFTDDFKNWRFATADKDTIEKLARGLGFYYKKTQGGFDHLNVVTVIDAKGKIYRHIYGIDFKPKEILGPVYQAARGDSDYKKPPALEATSIIERIKLFCYKYDESTGTYKPDYSFLMKTALEAITVFTIIIFIWGKEIKTFFLRRFGHQG